MKKENNKQRNKEAKHKYILDYTLRDIPLFKLIQVMSNTNLCFKGLGNGEVKIINQDNNTLREEKAYNKT